MEGEDSPSGKSPLSSKELLYSEKFNESPFMLKKKCSMPPNIFKVSESSVLKNVQMFLPKMQAANNDLEEKLKSMPASAVDIEHTDDTQGPLIEMDFTLVPQDESSEESECESESEESASNESDSDSEDVKSDIKLPSEEKKKGKCKIEVLDNNSTNESDISR